MLLLITSRTTSFEKSCVCAYLPIYFLPTCMKLKWQRLDLQSWWWWPTILQILLNVMFYRLPEYIPCWTVVLSWNSFSICRHTSCHLVMKVHVLEVIVCICVVHVCMCVCACVCVCCVCVCVHVCMCVCMCVCVLNKYKRQLTIKSTESACKKLAIWEECLLATHKYWTISWQLAAVTHPQLSGIKLTSITRKYNFQ